MWEGIRPKVLLGRLLYSIVILLCSALRTSAPTQLSLSIIPANQPVYLGEEVILTCQLKRFRTPLDYAVLFKHNEKGISEKCQAYNTDKYRLVCEPNNWQYATTYKLYIKSVSWTNRGDWYCIYAANVTTKRLDVFAPSQLQKMSVVSLASPRGQGQPTAALSSAGLDDRSLMASPPLQTDSLPSIQQQLQQQQQQQQHLGYGTRVNPYDLRRGFELQLSCSTTCGYPAANISWSVANESVSKPNLATARANSVSGETCNKAPVTENMTTTKSLFNVNCALFGGLVGLNEVVCEVHGPQYERAALTRSVFVLCPGGERPLYLTSGEVIAIAVGVALALVIVSVGCLLLRTNKKDLSPVHYGNYVPGQRV